MEPPRDLITGAEAARIIGVVPARMNGWRKRDDGKGPPFYVIETPGLRPRSMYSRAEVEAFSLRPRRPGRPTVRDLLIERVEALERAVEALGAKP